MWPGENKGDYTVGRGYTRYFDKPIPVCMERHQNGCPGPIPEMDPENARCCYRPLYKNLRRRKEIPCETCGSMAPWYAALELNKLPSLPGVPCRHLERDGTLKDWVMCRACRGGWDKPQVSEFEAPTHTFDDLLEELSRRLRL